MDQRYIRTAMLLSPEAIGALGHCHVAVFGLGGVGSYCVEALARSGVGRLTIVDHDVISASNINRQLQAAVSTVGQYKALALKQRVRDINPDCEVTALCQRFSRETASTFFPGDYSFVVDAIDLVSCKLDLIETALRQGVPIVSAMGTGNKTDPSQFLFTDISKTANCPLARVVRKELRRRGIYRHRVLYSPEEPRVPLPLEAPPPGRRSVPASAPWVPACAGMMLAGDVVMALTAQAAGK